MKQEWLFQQFSQYPKDYCKTKYPVVLLHGLNFGDHRPLDYWGDVPNVLRCLGGRVYFGGQDACGSIWDNANQIAVRIRQIQRAERIEKVNLIAHSKGGLEARYLASGCGMGQDIASIITISTPHHGCKTLTGNFAARIFSPLVVLGENRYGRILGDQYPDFREAAGCMSWERAQQFNRRYPDVPGILYQSWGAELSRSREDPLMALFYRVFYGLDGETDGFVSPQSSQWGEYRGTLFKISHQHLTGFRRRPGKYFDPCRFYVELVHELGKRGL
ncbi:MAG: esterase/lipase family protein [Massiliimalia sp.]